MTTDNAKRKQTDQALRAERDETDRKLGERGAAISEEADAVVDQARSRADAVLATARALADEQPLDDASRAAEAVERRHADDVLARERSVADAKLVDERNARARALADLLARASATRSTSSCAKTSRSGPSKCLRISPQR